jgi:O-antigen/teichoic acid export membrane protein
MSLKKSAFQLVSGTLISQVISFLSILVIARLYSVEAFGEYALILAISILLSAIATGKYELSLMNTDNQVESRDIVATTLSLSFFFSIFLFFTLIIANQYFFSMENILLIPIIVVIQSWFSSLIKWCSKNEMYGLITKITILNSIAVSLFQIIFGYFLQDKAGLLFAYMIGSFFSVFIMYLKIQNKEISRIKMVSFERSKDVMKKFRKFPKFQLPAVIISKLTQDSPIFLIELFFGTTVVGYFAMAQRIIRKPVALFSNNINLIFHREVSKIDFHGNKVFFKNTVMMLLFIILGFAPLIALLFTYGDSLFEMLLGQQWIESGRIAAILSLLILFQMLAVSIASTFLVFNQQKIMLISQFIHLMVISVAYFSAYLLSDEYYGYYLHVFFSSCFYIWIAVRALHMIKRHNYVRRG